MRRFFLGFCLLLLQPAFSQQDEVKQTILDFFKAFHARDTVAMKAVIDKEIVFHTVSEKASGVVMEVESRENFLRSVASMSKSIAYEERLTGWNIQVDKKLAHVWTPYEFYVNGQLVHTGVDSFQLYWKNGFWKIIYCADTRNRL